MNWKNKREQKARDVLEWLVADRDAHPRSLRMLNTANVAAVAILEQIASVPTDVPRITLTNDLAAHLPALISEPVPVDAVLKHLERATVTYLRKPLRRYVATTTWSLIHSSALKPVQLAGCRVSFSASFPRGYELPESLQQVPGRFSSRAPANYVHVRVQCDARDPADAFERTERAATLLRAIWNWWSLRSSGRPLLGHYTPLNAILPGPYTALHFGPGDPVENVMWYYPHYFEGPALHLPDKRYATMRTFDRNVRRRLRGLPYRDVLERLFVRFAGALDLPDASYGHLLLWGVLEGLTGSQKSGGLPARRASFLYENSRQHQVILEALGEQRHGVAHHGRDVELGQHLVLELFRYVDRLFERALLEERLTNFAEIGQMLDSPISIKDLERRLEIIETAARVRRSAAV